MYKKVIFLILMVLYLNTAFSQFPGLNPATGVALQDTGYNESDTIINKNGFFSLFKGKPGKAALYSLIIPSGGQIYNKKWWKVPLALGIDGGLAYVLITNRKSYKESQNEYVAALNKQPVPSNLGLLKQQRDYYRKWSEYAWIWIIAGHLLTVVDAYVDRHLMDFDISSDLTSAYNLGNVGFPLYAKAGIKINLCSNPIKKVNPNYTIVP